MDNTWSWIQQSIFLYFIPEIYDAKLVWDPRYSFKNNLMDAIILIISPYNAIEDVIDTILHTIWLLKYAKKSVRVNKNYWFSLANNYKIITDDCIGMNYGASYIKKIDKPYDSETLHRFVYTIGKQFRCQYEIECSSLFSSGLCNWFSHIHARESIISQQRGYIWGTLTV